MALTAPHETTVMILDALHSKQPIAFALHLEVRDQRYPDADSAAIGFGIRPLATEWRAVDRETASRVLFTLLIKDMAFSSPRMSEDEAKAAADEFMHFFPTSSRFFTNGRWEEGWIRSKDGGPSFGPSWSPATNATFDGGVIALSDSRAGILWLEDED